MREINISANKTVWEALQGLNEDILEAARKRAVEKAIANLKQWVIATVRTAYRDGIYNRKKIVKKIEKKKTDFAKWQKLLLKEYKASKINSKIAKERLKTLREKKVKTKWNKKIYERKEKELKKAFEERKLVGETLSKVTDRYYDLKFTENVLKREITYTKVWLEKKFLKENGLKVWKDEKGNWHCQIEDWEKVKKLLILFFDEDETVHINAALGEWEEINSF
jgi:hypothetical protein